MSLWLIGAGQMAQDYAKVLSALDVEFEVIGRSAASAEKFLSATGIAVQQGGVKEVLAKRPAPEQAIVATEVTALAGVTAELINAGTRRILIEKPGGVNSQEIRNLETLARDKGAEVLLAYNRRFYASTDAARKLIAEDGGPASATFEFTEWSHLIAPLKTSSLTKERWFLANSTHVVDLFIHLCGIPKNWQAFNGGTLDWHPSASRFCGAGITGNNVFFSYHADWQAPGRWGLEVLTSKHRFIFRPMEALQVISLGSVAVNKVEIDDQLDKQFKPGLFRQVKSFIDAEDDLFCSLAQQLEHCAVYDEMAGYTNFQKTGVTLA